MTELRHDAWTDPGPTPGLRLVPDLPRAVGDGLLAPEAGLDQDTARSAWEGATGEGAVADDVALAQEIGVRGVPFFVFDETYSAPGAIPLDAFRQVLRSLADGTAP